MSDNTEDTILRYMNRCRFLVELQCIHICIVKSTRIHTQRHVQVVTSVV
jgi:hypothetical protein